jgi:RNA polymerase sigma factor (sigma-70 family)
MGHKYEEVFESWEIAIAKGLVRRFMVKWPCLAEESLDTLAGECLVRWLIAKEKYNPRQRASEKTYMAKVVYNILTDMVRARMAKKSRVLADAVSLAERVGDESENDLTLLETIDPAKIFGGPADPASPISLRHDVAKVLSGLTERQQELCRLRMSGMDMDEASRALGISRDTAYEERKRIRKIFEKAGLSDYVR